MTARKRAPAKKKEVVYDPATCGACRGVIELHTFTELSDCRDKLTRTILECQCEAELIMNQFT